MKTITVVDWISIGNGYYVWHDGTIHYGATEGNTKDMYNRGWWHTKEEADKFLREWLPQSPWLDKEAVKLAAGRSDMSALLSSITHWRQIVVNWDSFREADFEDKVGTHADYCALCQRHLGNGDCPLRKECDGHCCDEWKHFTSEETLENAIEMHNRLVTLLNQWKELKAKSKIEESKKMEFKPGEVVEWVHDGGGVIDIRIIAMIAGELVAIDLNGYVVSRGQRDFEMLGYQKVGRIIDYFED